MEQEAAELLAGKLTRYLDIAEKLVGEYAPKAAEAALTVVQIAAIAELAFGFVCLLSAPFIVRKFINYVQTQPLDESHEFIFSLILGLGSILSVAFGAANVLSIYNWLAAFNPVLALIYKVMP